MAIAVPAQFAPLMVPVGNVQPDPRNARKHDERNIDAIKRSLQSFGWRSVLVANKKTKQLLSGNGRLRAAMELEEAQVPVLFVDADSEQAAAYAIMDNRTAELAGWDDKVLAGVLRDLQSSVDVADVGFDDNEMDALLASLDDVDAGVEDVALPEPPERPEAKVQEDASTGTASDHLVPEKMPSSNVRMIQLFLDDTTVEPFNLAVRKLAEKHKTENVTDTVREVVLAAAAAL